MTMVAVDAMPILCAVRMTRSQSSVMIFFGAMSRRTRSTRISAPPPGSDASPASWSRRSVSSTEMPSFSAKYRISVAVKE